MANSEHVKMLSNGVEAWNQWRSQNPEKAPDLVGVNIKDMDLSGIDLRRARILSADLSAIPMREADLRDADLRGACLEGADLQNANFTSDKSPVTGYRLRPWTPTQFGQIYNGADLRGVNLKKANLSNAKMMGADLRGASLDEANVTGGDLRHADLRSANLKGIDLSNADLRNANLMGANISSILATHSVREPGKEPVESHSKIRPNLTHARLNGADLRYVSMVDADLRHSDISDCFVYGVSAWDLLLDGAVQRNLIITPVDVSEISVDDIEIAQFVFLLLNNRNIRRVIDTVASKAVLILGRFTVERKSILDGLREQLRTLGYLPILFDFEKPSSRDLTETISTLAHISKFILADITDAKSIPQELMHIVPTLPSVPVQPILQGDSSEYAMYEFFRHYPWVLPVYKYSSLQELSNTLATTLLGQLEQLAAK